LRRPCSIRPPAVTLAIGSAWEEYGEVREFIDFWIENSIHAVEQYRTVGASQDVAELSQRLVEAAKGQGISEADLQTEIGDISDYIRDRLKAANRAESERRKPT